MNAPLSPTDLLQRQASDPRRSAWVSANAGSGKTFVLTRRVERLLLAGADPARILCLTFTKAAAAEMAKRIFADLARWVRLGDAELGAELARIEDEPPSAAKLTRARRLFAEALETPGGLKIQTVHAFCERLLHQFPFEANVAGHFEVLEENAANALVAEARRRVLARAATDLEAPLGRALRTVVLAASDRGHEEAIAEFVEKREQLQRWIIEVGGFEAALDDLRTRLGLTPADTVDGLAARILDESTFTDRELATLVAILEKNGGNDRKAAERLQPYFTAGATGPRLDAYRSFFCKADGDLRKPGSMVTKAAQNAFPGIVERLTEEMARLQDLLDRTASAEVYENSAAILRIAHAVIEDYEAQKRARGFLDFDDLIVRTKALFDRDGASRWVHYKVDQGLDHILLDEAQDTSPLQWDVVKALADDFFAGEGARDSIRTLFAVGDEKQSIYSFQGAVPSWFRRVREEIRQRAEAADRDWTSLELHVSFRSTPDIVGAVDRTFLPVLAHTGLSTEPQAPAHEAARRNEPGRVVIWPMIEPPPERDSGAWDEAFDHIGDAAPEMVLASRIAATVRAWLDPRNPERLEATGTPIRAGSILVLTRKRGALSETINRALKAAGVPVAGADRLALAGHIAVMDLLALGDVMLQDRDDLSLAAVLKSPLFGLDEDALFALAHERDRLTLWSALGHASDAEPFAGTFRTLKALRARADFVGPYAFFAHVLGPLGARRNFARRLGAEAEDVLDEFLAQAMVYERMETPSLQGFIAWMRAAATEIRRETETVRDEVRVMTVHGAKGLEADIVFLVDDGSAPVHAGHDPDVLLMSDDPDGGEAAPLVWTRGVRRLPRLKAMIDRLRERAREEYRRLLYVAATRARDRLYVCGTVKERTTDPVLGWHALVSSQLLPEATLVAAIDGSEAWEWRAEGARPAAAPVDPPPVATVLPDVPAWLTRRAPPPKAGLRALRPSTALAAAASAGRAPLEARLQSAGDALDRGRIVHRLMEALPERPAAERRSVAERYLEAFRPEWPAERRDATVAEIMAVLEDPAFAAVFAAGSRAEVEIIGRLASGRGTEAVAGRVDRLAITPAEVLIVDYKTNRPAPATLAEAPRGYVAQLAIYRQVLAGLYPGRRIGAALLWTDAPRLMEIPADAMDAALAAVLGRDR